MNIAQLIDVSADTLESANVSYGHGTTNAYDEAAWLVLWRLGLPLDTPLDGPDAQVAQSVSPDAQQQVQALVQQRITSRLPAAYLTGEAWLQGVAFYVDARCIVPRSLIGELITNGILDSWMPSDAERRLLDLCTGGGSLAILSALADSELQVDATDISNDALDVARSNVQRHALETRVRLRQGDGMAAADGVYDMIVCNPPYVNSASMARLPPEYRAEPIIALAGGSDGMDFIRSLLQDAPAHLSAHGVLVLEIGHERAHFEAAFPTLATLWLETSAGGDQVCLLTRDALLAITTDTLN